MHQDRQRVYASFVFEHVGICLQHLNGCRNCFQKLNITEPNALGKYSVTHTELNYRKPERRLSQC